MAAARAGLAAGNEKITGKSGIFPRVAAPSGVLLPSILQRSCLWTGPLWARRGLLLGLGFLAAGLLAAPEVRPPSDGLELTPEQTTWLAAHPDIRLASDPAWPPFSFGDGTGRLSGLDMDLVRLVEKRLGRRFRRVDTANWSEAYRLGRARAVDVLSGMGRSQAREEYFRFTTAYLSQSFGIITRRDAPFMATYSQLAGRRVAVVPDHAVTERLRQEQPDALLVTAADTVQALRLVSEGKADATLTDLVNASYIIKMDGLTNLKIAGVAQYRFELHFGVRRDWPELVGILDAAIASLDAAEKQAVVDRWVHVDYADVARWSTVWRMLACATAGVLLVVTGVFWHNGRLRRELAERRRVEADLRAARDRLEEMHGEKNQLLDMAAHDLRNPLTGVMLSLEVIDTDNPVERRQVINEVTVLTRHMVQLINDLLDAQVLENGRRVFQRQAVELGRIVREVAAENRRAAARKRITLLTEPPDGGCVALADAGAVRQIVDNLLSNALKYSPLGGCIWILLEGHGATVRLLVRDEGPGISHQDMQRLFQKYARLSARPTAGEASVGLGLAIVQQLAEGLGGKVTCQTELGRGATFIVELPAVPAGAPATLRASAALCT
jgi:ABC-type amino acid transport substrate-binding protein/nitrogen-specific signal transduction histidine kinase